MSDFEYINLVLGIIISGNIKEIEITDEAGRYLRTERIDTFPHSSFLPEIFENYNYLEFEKDQTHQVLGDIFKMHFYYTRSHFPFFRVYNYFNERLFYKLPPQTKYTKSNTIGIIESQQIGIRIIDEENKIVKSEFRFIIFIKY